MSSKEFEGQYQAWPNGLRLFRPIRRNICKTTLTAALFVGFCGSAFSQSSGPVLSPPRADEAGGFQVGIQGGTGEVYAVQASTNLTAWGTIAVLTNATGTVSVGDAQARSYGQRFYRAAALSDAASAIAESYCARAGILSAAARTGVHGFVEGLAGLGLATNLVDFAFFEQGRNTASGDLVSWQNTGVIVGNVNRLRGGIDLNNQQGTTNYFYFTNLPPLTTHTLVVWGAVNMATNLNVQDANSAVFELVSDGPLGTLPATLEGFIGIGGGLNWISWNGSSQVVGGSAQALGCAGYAPTAGPFCVALSTSPLGDTCVVKRDYDFFLRQGSWTNTYTTPPTVLRFGVRQIAQSAGGGWGGLVRGFALFNAQLGESQVLAIDALVPRVGLVIEGDSKSVELGVDWARWWANGPGTWGLFSVRTNSAVGGSTVSANNSADNNMQSRWPADSAYTTNSQFPLLLYALRGGHNDFSGTNLATQAGISNAFTAITNLWALARANGDKVVGWTVDRTASTSSPGNSNYLASLNASIRAAAASGLCDYLVDIESWYVANYGPAPWTNTTLYTDGIHDRLAAPMLGTNALQGVAPGLGYDLLDSP